MAKTSREHLQSDPGSRFVKAFPADVKAVDGQERQFRFTITTDDVDREKDIISADGWKLDNYLANPVVLFAHDYRQPPVGVSRSLERTAKGLSSVCEFADPADYGFAGTIAALVRMGALRATSVGFRTLEWTWDETRGGINFLSQELLEYSIVPVPANPNCLIEARVAGIDVEPLREWAAHTLERLSADVPKPASLDLPDLSAFKAQIDEACGAVNRLTLSVAGLKDALVAPAPVEEPKVDTTAVLPAIEPAREAPAEGGVASDQGGGTASDIDLEDIEDDDMSDDDIRSAVREALTDITSKTVAAAMNRRLGRVD